MFKALGLFKEITCPVKSCSLPGCLFSHKEQVDDISTPKRLKSNIQGFDQSKSVTNPTQIHLVDQDLKSAETAKSDQDQTDSSAVLGPQRAAKKASGPQYVSRATSTSDISIKLDPRCSVAHESRLHYLRAYKKQFDRIYAAFDNEIYEKLTRDHAIEQEKYVVSKNNKGTYKQASRNALIALTRRQLAIDENDIGIYPSYKPPVRKQPNWSSMVHPKKILTAWGYTTEIPVPDSEQSDEEGCDRICERCNQRFIVTADKTKWLSCTYHPGKSQYKVDKGQRITYWTCCDLSSQVNITNETAVAGCHTALTHVFKVDHPPRLASYSPYRMLPLFDSQHSEIPQIEIAAVDCEMVFTTASFELARVSITLPDGTALLDSQVIPERPILDYNTRFSGITATALADDDKAMKPSQLLENLQAVGITRDTILVGHGLENDLTAMRLVHHNVIDSAILFPHPRGRPYRNGLKYLVKRYLNKNIQTQVPVINLAAKRNGATSDLPQGHDSLEDARSAMELVIWRMEHGDQQVGDTPFAGKLK